MCMQRVVFVGVLVSLLLTGCMQPKTPLSTEDPLIGQWETNNFELTIDVNGTGHLQYGTVDVDFTYRWISNDTIEVHFPVGTYTIQYEFEDEDTLLIVFDEENYRLERV